MKVLSIMEISQGGLRGRLGFGALWVAGLLTLMTGPGLRQATAAPVLITDTSGKAVSDPAAALSLTGCPGGESEAKMPYVAVRTGKTVAGAASTFSYSGKIETKSDSSIKKTMLTQSLEAELEIKFRKKVEGAEPSTQKFQLEVEASGRIDLSRGAIGAAALRKQRTALWQALADGLAGAISQALEVSFAGAMQPASVSVRWEKVADGVALAAIRKNDPEASKVLAEIRDTVSAQLVEQFEGCSGGGAPAKPTIAIDVEVSRFFGYPGGGPIKIVPFPPATKTLPLRSATDPFTFYQFTIVVTAAAGSVPLANQAVLVDIDSSFRLASGKRSRGANTILATGASRVPEADGYQIVELDASGVGSITLLRTFDVGEGISAVFPTGDSSTSGLASWDFVVSAQLETETLDAPTFRRSFSWNITLP